MDIRDLAKHLGLSIGTVSRALNNRKDVSPTTRQRVIEAAARLDYTPNQSGRTLRSGRTGTIGFMLTLDHDNALHGAPFFMAVLAGVQSGLAQAGLDLIVLLARKGEDGLAFLRRHVARGTVDGWLLSATEVHDARVSFLHDQGTPFVALGRSSLPIAYDWIDLDFESVVAEAMATFRNWGHRRIGVIAPPILSNISRVVVDCYREALAEAGLPFDPTLVHHGDMDEQGSEMAAIALMTRDHPPTALLLLGETTPIGVYRALRRQGLEPGRDVALIGLRDNPACRGLCPDLTCFTLALEELGLALARGLITALSPARDAQAPRLEMLWPMRMLEGDSHRIDARTIAPV